MTTRTLKIPYHGYKPSDRSKANYGRRCSQKSALLPKPRKRRWEEGALARDRPASTTAGRGKFLKATARFRRRSSPVNGGHAAPAIAAARAPPSQSAGPGPPGARQPPRANRPPSPAPSLPALRPRMRLRQPAARGAAALLLPPPLPPARPAASAPPPPAATLTLNSSKSAILSRPRAPQPSPLLRPLPPKTPPPSPATSCTGAPL